MTTASESRKANIAQTERLLVEQGLTTQQIATHLSVHYSTANDYVRALDGADPGRKTINWTRDEIILACELTRTNNWRPLGKKDRRVVALSVLLNENSLHPAHLRDETYRNPAGVARKTSDIATRHPNYSGRRTNGSKLDEIVLNDFLLEPAKMQAVAAAIHAEIRQGHAAPPNEDDLDDEDLGVAEGRLLLVRHLKRERNRGLRDKKIASAKKAGRAVACEVCFFNFRTTYGPRGHDYIDVHHVLPLHASGPTTTHLEDLALLCANCHRMIHRSNPWLTPKELEALLTSRD